MPPHVEGHHGDRPAASGSYVCPFAAIAPAFGTAAELIGAVVQNPVAPASSRWRTSIGRKDAPGAAEAVGGVKGRGADRPLADLRGRPAHARACLPTLLAAVAETRTSPPPIGASVATSMICPHADAPRWSCSPCGTQSASAYGTCDQPPLFASSLPALASVGQSASPPAAQIDAWPPAHPGWQYGLLLLPDVGQQ